MNDKAEIVLDNKEQKKVIDELEEVLSFLKSAQIKDEDVLSHIKKPSNDLQSSLKYIPIHPYFEIVPTEIKTKILTYLCDSNAFTAASVCLEWKEILESRFTGETVTLRIGELCYCYQCRDHEFVNRVTNSEMLKASAAHKLDVHLVISHSVREVDSKVVTDALTSVSRFSLIGKCTCDNEKDDSFETVHECELNLLSTDQLKDLFKGLEKKIETMEEVELRCLDLNELNQDRLAHCFVNKIKNLTLREDYYYDRMFNVETLVNKLSQETAELKLNQLTLDLEYPHELALELANAVCNVENVKLVTVRLESVTQLIENIITDTRPVAIKTLIIKNRDFRTIISPEDLKRLCSKLATLRLAGYFSMEQRKAARSLPDVEVSGTFSIVIKKGFNIF